MIGDIGSHWLDLASFLTGHRVEAVMADLTTFMPVRKEPVGRVETFTDQRRARDRDREIETEDAAGLLVRFEGGARGVATLSQVSGGRKNHLHWEINGSRGERRLAGRAPRRSCGSATATRPNELLLREPGAAPHAAAHRLPAGHAEGFGETFRELYRAVYPRSRSGRATRRAGLPDLRRRPRAGADRRRDRALARRGPVGRSAALKLGVVFDCDGTLVDSEPLAGEAWRRVLAPYGYEVTEEDLAACVGRSYAHTHAYLSQRAPLPDAATVWPVMLTATCSR